MQQQIVVPAQNQMARNAPATMKQVEYVEENGNHFVILNLVTPKPREQVFMALQSTCGMLKTVERDFTVEHLAGVDGTVGALYELHKQIMTSSLTGEDNRQRMERMNKKVTVLASNPPEYFATREVLEKKGQQTVREYMITILPSGESLVKVKEVLRHKPGSCYCECGDYEFNGVDMAQSRTASKVAKNLAHYINAYIPIQGGGMQQAPQGNGGGMAPGDFQQFQEFKKFQNMQQMGQQQQTFAPGAQVVQMPMPVNK